MTRTVVITGAAGGVGAAAVTALHRQGWEVIGCDLQPRPSTAPVRAWVQGDVTDDAVVESVRDAVGDDLDALVHAAAVQINSSFRGTTLEDWHRSLAVNLTAPLRLSQLLLPALERRRGSILVIGSVHAVATSEHVFPYAVSKAALVGLVRSIALEVAPSGVRCNAVLLGAVDTGMLRAGLLRRGASSAAAELDALAARTPAGFVARPEDVVATILHLVEPGAAPYLTGQSIVIDGGASLRLATE